VSAPIAQVQPLSSSRALRGPFDYRLSDDLRESVQVGSLLVVPFGRREVLGVVVRLAQRSEIAEDRLLEPLRALQAGVPADLVELAAWVAAQYCSTVPRALKLVLPPGLTRGQLSGKPRRTRVRRPEHLSVGVLRGAPPELTAEQEAALARLTAALAPAEPAGAAEPGSAATPQPQLLHGVTGSGKTEIYLRLAAGVLERGSGVIVMVPEIALTPQMLARFLERFGETVAVLHSRLTPPQRREEWRRLRSGEARVCVGPRSAVFAPIERLGLIVLDEEHDSSYKHEGDPRYDAREVAAQRAAQTGALLLAGSATPRPESILRMQRIRLPRRVDGRPLPGVELLDMRGRHEALHPRSAQALAELRRDRGKAIVLLNRRGWSNFLSCRACGTVWSCPNCDVTLVMHRAEGLLACHHCDHREAIPSLCECGSSTLARHGTGTERLQDELAATLDDGSFPVFRLDADTAGAEPAQLLAAFQEAPAGVLIGTQMVAKGHDFSDVALGIVLDADATLRFPDFRAEERTFALVAQLAGRVGRGAEGHVLVQTLAPEARSLLDAAAHDSDGFLAGELERRRALSYPPYAHLARVVCSAVDGEPALRAASALAAALQPARRSGQLSLLGPASLFRLRGRERQALVVKSADRAGAVRAIDAAVQAVASDRAHAGVSFAVDVDPQ
jgi:primosomal protein N' (replication factor Y) (superfamily II helicase)